MVVVKEWVVVLLCLYPLPFVLLLRLVFRRLKEEFLQSHFRWRKNVWYPNEIKKAFERRTR